MANRVLDEVFTKYLKNKPVFTNRGALTLSYTPHTIPHRDEQTTELGKILAPALKGGKPSNVFIYGGTGTGKSLVSALVGEELQKISDTNGIPVKFVYINCKMKKQADTEYRLLAGILKEFGKEVPFTGLPTDQIYNIFFKTMDEKEQTIILIIDEIDTLVQKNGDEILYNLTRMNQELKKAKVSIIGITNNLNFIDSLDPRVRSSLGEEEIIFPPYNAVQLQDILRTRAILAFQPDIVADGVIEKCAALGAQEHGDARRALDLLRVAGELAERSNDEEVKIGHVDAAEEKIDLDRVLETVKAQPRQSQLILYAIMELGKGEMQTGEVFDRYQELCREFGYKVLTQRRISDLISELDLFGILNTKVVSKGRYGRTRIISLSLSTHIQNKLKKLLYQIFL